MTAARKNVVITGSSRGIGKGMALEFLKRGHNVVISGRSHDTLKQTQTELDESAKQSDATLTSHICDVSVPEQVEALWQHSVQALGSVDIWINNAGITNKSRPIAELEQQEIRNVPLTNIVGLIYCCQTAMNGMAKQGHGAIYNFEGFGSNGQHAPGNSLYGTTKYAVRYFTKALELELKESSILVGTISPGMVVTDLLIGDRNKLPPEAWGSIRRIYNILADHVETVCPFIVEHVLNNTKHGVRIAWLTKKKIFWRFLTSRFNKRELFESNA